jgi:hypothetical protein
LGVVSIAFGALASSPALALGSPTVTTLTSSQNPSAGCGTVTFTATVYGAIFPDSPIGAVQFFDGASTLGGITPITFDFDTFLGAHVVPTNHSSASISVQLSGGTHAISVVYAGLDVPSSAGPLVQSVNAATSSTTVTSSVNPSVYGQSVSFTSAVSSACAGSVAGSVQFQADGTDLGAAQTLDSGHASIAESTLPAGTHPIAAAFTSSNTDVDGSNGSLVGGQVVNAADTTTAVSSSANPSEYGGAVTFTAATTVNAPGSGTPSGTVQFKDNGTSIGAPQSLDGTGHASIARSDLSVGNHTIAAIFTSGSSNFNNSNGSIGQTVNKARTTLTYGGATGADYHDHAALSATLTRTDNGAPIAGLSVTLTMGSESCTPTTDANGQAACTITPTEAAATLTVSAGFAGDGNYLASNDSAAFQVTKEETTVTYSGPSVVLAGSGGATLSAQLVEEGTNDNDGDGAVSAAPNPSGQTVTFVLGSQTCSGTTNAAGLASCTIGSVLASTLGSKTVSTSSATDSYYLGSSDSDPVVVFSFPSRGAFVLGNSTVIAATAATTVNWWNDSWSSLNSLSAGIAPLSFKGFAGTPRTLPTTSPAAACGTTFTTDTGSSAPPPNGVPSYMGVLVASSVTKTGATLNGVWSRIVVVQTNPGYSSSAGHPGTGRIVATFCG